MGLSSQKPVRWPFVTSVSSTRPRKICKMHINSNCFSLNGQFNSSYLLGKSMKAGTRPGVETPWKIFEQENNTKIHDNPMVKNWSFHGSSMIEAMAFTSIFHGFYGKLHNFSPCFCVFFHGCFMQLTCEIMEV